MADRVGRRPLRALLIGLGVLVLLIVAAAGIAWASFDPNTLKPRIAAAVKRATGRDLALAGPLTFTPGLSPVIAASDVSLANIAGGSRPAMATAGRVEFQVALLPLLSHRVVIERLTLLRPDILLERGPDGTGNWVMRPAQPAQPLPQATPAETRTPMQTELHALRIEDGRLTWRDRAGRATMIGIPRLDATAAGDSAPVDLSASLLAHGVPVTLTAATGPVAALRAGKPASPWPVKLGLAALGGHAAAEGTLADPDRLGGYDLALDGAVPDLAAFDRIFPHARLPALHDVSASLHLVDGGLIVPRITALKLHLGASDPGGRLSFLHIASLDLTDAAPDQPSHLDLHGAVRGAPVALSGSFGPPSALLPAAGTPFRVDLAGQAAAASFTARGEIGAPLAMTGKSVAVTAKVPDLAALDALAGRKLPALHDLDIAFRLGDRPDGFALDELKASSAAGDLAGFLAVSALSTHPRIEANLTSQRLDLDAMQAALPPAPPPAPPVQPAPPPAPVAGPAGPPRLIPDKPLPLDTLRTADADIRLTVASLRAGGVEDRNVVARLLLVGGHLTLAPLTADTPGGPAQAALEVDAGRSPPTVGVVIRAPQLALAPLLAALHVPAEAEGTISLDADLHGAGATLRALAATVDGRLGLSMVDGALDNALVTRFFGSVLNSAHLPAELIGKTDVRCLALRFDAAHGMATLGAFDLDTSRLSMTGGGTVNLADEGLALHFQPLLRLGGTGVAVPVKLDGTLAAPRAALDAVQGGRVGAVIGALGTATGDSCGPALAASRNGAPGPAPAPEKRRGVDPGELLRLFQHKGR